MAAQTRLFTAALEIDAVGLAAVDKTPFEKAGPDVTLVAIDCQQPVTALDVPSRRANSLTSRTNHSCAIRPGTPARSFSRHRSNGRRRRR